jgi:hypothetical protein
MTNSFLLSTVTAILMTGAVLVHLQNHHDDTENLHQNETDLETDDDMFYNEFKPNPKIANVATSNLSNVKMKRSSQSFVMDQYSIDDKNLSMIDFGKREKIKEVFET